MADKFEPGPDGIDAAKAWLRGDIKKGSPRDLPARRALEGMLRVGNVTLIHILADAIKDGRLVMKRKRGRRQANAYLIAVFIDQRTKAGVKLESAVKGAMTQFKVSRSTAFGAWSEWRPHIERDPKLFGRI